MLKTLTLLLTLCVSGGDTYQSIFTEKWGPFQYKNNCPYDFARQCNTFRDSCCRCLDGDEGRTEVKCRKWDDTTPISFLPPYRAGNWPQTNLIIYASIETLPSGKFPPRMKMFECQCHKLKDVPADFFAGSEGTMQEIEIFNTKMTSISSFKALGKLTALRSLTMDSIVQWFLPKDGGGTSLTDVRFSSFSRLPFKNTLTKLALRDNWLRSIPDTSMLTSLVELYLNDNNIHDSDTTTFSPSIKKLDLWNHYLSRLPLALAQLTKLTYLVIIPAKNNRHFRCTCGEASLTTWYAALVKNNGYIFFRGKCKYGSSTITVEHFLKQVGLRCPKNGPSRASAGYRIYSSPVLSFFCLVICLLVYVS